MTRDMDLQSALRGSGQRWQLARIGALLCFALACGLLVTSLAGPSKAAYSGLDRPAVLLNAAR